MFPIHFTKPYIPRSNGAIERLRKEVIRVALTFLSELKLRIVSWIALQPIFQSILNNSPSTQRGNNSTQRGNISPIKDLLDYRNQHQ